MFYDPADERVIDYVGGEEDLRRSLVRAIGNPHARFAEDKLRMLRAVRFAATYQFAIDGPTLAAVQQHAAEVTVVSAERIAAEMRMILVHAQRADAVRMLHQTELLAAILPEVDRLDGHAQQDLSGDECENGPWQRTLDILHGLVEPRFPTALAALLREIESADLPSEPAVRKICRRWRLSGEETQRTCWLVANEQSPRQAGAMAWPRLQRLLVHDGIDDLLVLAEAVARVIDGTTGQIDLCRAKLKLPSQQLNPPPLISGDDLIDQGIPPGKAYRPLLESVRDAQLEGKITDQQQALDWADRWWQEHGKKK